MPVNDVLTELSDNQDNSNLERSFGSDTAATVCLYASQPTGGSGEPGFDMEADSCEPSSEHLLTPGRSQVFTLGD